MSRSGNDISCSGDNDRNPFIRLEHYQQLLAAAMAITWNIHDAENAVQEAALTLIKVLKSGVDAKGKVIENPLGFAIRYNGPQ